ncbi:hypothetical protein SteCoe_13718 [Stentor coeruleus]|uniref:Cyclic nucleotide-binding domain-containing protein n=1 Tax=Stentor coeruleus TaxID=5963 RepID=A0A1R2C7S3_9CILI|nr:hypothetical protein SteCoe_13718 [Stentor coeruleus]
MVRVHPSEAAVRNNTRTLWKTVADDLRKQAPKTRECEEYEHIKWVIFPDDTFNEYWGSFMSMLLLYTCLVSPYRVCVVEIDEAGWMYSDVVIDFCFFIDVVVNSFLAYYDKESNLIVSKRKILFHYLKSWMFVDILSCFPLQFIMDQKNYSTLLRISRVSKLYKLAKMIRFLRMLRLARNKNRIMKYMNTIFRVHMAIERLVWFLITFLLLVHILACLWVFIGRFDMANSDQNWIFMNKMVDYDEFRIYLTAVYWATTTLTTVGYGDIRAYNSNERIFACMSMIIGIFLYSYIIGSLTNLLSNLDIREAKLTRKLDIVNRLHREYPSIDKNFYKKIATALEYKHKNTKSNIDTLLSDLPLTLRTKLLIVIYQRELQSNTFFENKKTDFVAFLAPMLKPMRIEEGDYVFKKKELAFEMYFIISGEIHMTIDIENSDNKSQVEVLFNALVAGYYFGETDLLFSESRERSYNSKAAKKAELLSLPKEGFESMLKMFEEEGTQIMTMAYNRNLRLREKQQEAIEIYNKSQAVRRLVSIPISEDFDMNTGPIASINVIPADTSEVQEEATQTRNMYNAIIEDKMGKVESDIVWTKRKLKNLKYVVSEARENLTRVYEALM